MDPFCKSIKQFGFHDEISISDLNNVGTKAEREKYIEKTL